MFLAIEHTPSGETLLLRRIAPNEILDAEEYARQFCRDHLEGAAPVFSRPGAHIANGCGEYRAEIRRTKASTGCCWISADFFLDGGEC